MSTQPSSPAPAPGGPHQAQATVRSGTPSSVVPFIGAVITLLLGVALGLANQAADGTAMALRVPALLAALLMVGQGAYDIKRHAPELRPREVPQPQQQSRVISESGQPARGAELATVHPLPPPRPITGGAVNPNPQTLAVPITVMVLAAWLGLADLRVESTTALAALSLVASFALFALGWTLLPARR